MTGVAPPFVLSTETTTLSTSSYPGYPLILVFCQSKNQIRMVTGKPLALPTLVYSGYIFPVILSIHAPARGATSEYIFPFNLSYGIKERVFPLSPISDNGHHFEHTCAYFSPLTQN